MNILNILTYSSDEFITLYYLTYLEKIYLEGGLQVLSIDSHSN